MRSMLQPGLLFFSMSLALAQMASGAVAEIRKVSLIPAGSLFRIQVTLTSPVIPSVLIATDPDRVVLQFPNTEGESRQRRIKVNRNGVGQVRVGLNSANPPITRLVVDLDRPHPYGLTSSGNTIVLTVLPVSSPTSREENGVDELAGATSSRKWWRQRKSDSPDNQVPAPAFSVRGETSGSAQPGASTLLVVTPKGKTARMSFKVKYVAEGAAYLSGGRRDGLSEGMKLIVCEYTPCPADAGAAGNSGSIAAELHVASVAETSAVTEIVNASRAIKPGEWAYLSADDYSRLTGVRDLDGATRGGSLVPESTGRQVGS